MFRRLRVYIPVGSLALLLSEILLITGAFVLAGSILFPGWKSVILVVLGIVAGLYLQDLYTEIHVSSRIILLQQVCRVIGMAFLMQGLISYLDPALRMPVRVMTVGSALAMAGIFGWRIAFSAWVVAVIGRERLLLVGDSPVLAQIARYVAEHPEKGMAITGYVREAPERGAPLPGGKVLGPLESLPEIVGATRPSHIVLGMHERRSSMPVNELLELRFSGNIIEEAASTYERVCGRVCVREIRPSQLIYSGEWGPRRETLLYQSLRNLLVAGIGALVTAPVMLLVALAVRLSSRGPVLYRQVRVGMDGAPFTLYKFRSMRTDAEAATGAVWATQNDPRITRVGRILRKSRLDELPQLFNVLRGEMSIVGPRPERPEFVKTLASHIPYYRQRHSVRPGITGWAQINYRYGENVEDTIQKLEYDLFYIKNMSLSLDSYIIFHTLKTMLLSRGAQ